MTIEKINSRASLDRSPKENWVDRAGGLPMYIRRIANHLHQEKGKTIGHSIAIAVNAVKKMCATGDVNWPGAQQVNAKSRAEACAAVASWERKKAGARVSKGDLGRKWSDDEFIKHLTGEEVIHKACDCGKKKNKRRDELKKSRVPAEMHVNDGSELPKKKKKKKNEFKTKEVTKYNPKQPRGIGGRWIKVPGGKILPMGTRYAADNMKGGRKEFKSRAKAQKWLWEGVNKSADISDEEFAELLEEFDTDPDTDTQEFEVVGDIEKSDDEKQMVFGWCSIAKDKGGNEIVDKQGDVLDDIDQMEHVAYDFVLHSRDGGEMHVRKGVSTLVESFVSTPEKWAAMGIPEGTLPVGWWVGFKVNDANVWKSVKDGKYKMFSVHGSGTRKAYDE